MSTETAEIASCESCGCQTARETACLCRDCAMQEIPAAFAASITPSRLEFIASNPSYAHVALEEFTAAFWQAIADEQARMIRAGA